MVRAGALPQAAASTSQVRISLRAVAGPDGERTGSRSGWSAQRRQGPGLERREHLGVEVGRQPGLAAHDDAPSPRLRTPPSAPALQPGRHKVPIIVVAGGPPSGNASGATTHPS